MHWRRSKPQPKDSFDDQRGPEEDAFLSSLNQYRSRAFAHDAQPGVEDRELEPVLCDCDACRKIAEQDPGYWQYWEDKINNETRPGVLYPSYNGQPCTIYKSLAGDLYALSEDGRWSRIGGPTRLPYTGAFPEWEVPRR